MSIDLQIRSSARLYSLPKKLFLSYALNDIDTRPRTGNDEDVDKSSRHEKSDEGGSKSLLNALLDVQLDVSESDGSHGISPWDCIEDVDFSSEMGTAKFTSSNKHGLGNFPSYSSSHNVLKSDLRTVLSPYDGVANTTTLSSSSIHHLSAPKYMNNILPCEPKSAATTLSEDEVKKLTSESLLGLEDINYITTSPHIPDHIKRIVLLASVSPNLESTLDKNEIMPTKSVAMQHMEWKRPSSSEIQHTPCPATYLPSSTMVTDFNKNMECSSLNALADTATACTELESREFRLQLPQTQHILHRNRPRLWKGRSDASRDLYSATPDLSVSLNSEVSEFSASTEMLNLDTNIPISGALSAVEDYSEKHLNSCINPKFSVTGTTNRPETDSTFAFRSNNPSDYASIQAPDFSCSSNNSGMYDRAPPLPLSVYRPDCAPLSEMSTEKRSDLQVTEGATFLRSEFTSLLDAEVLPNNLPSGLMHSMHTDSNFVEDLSNKETLMPLSCNIQDTRSVKMDSQKHLACKDEAPTNMTFHDLSEIKVKEEIEIGSTVSSSAPARKGNRCRTREKKHSPHLDRALDCQVCGDAAAGFYCGAYICEACKKFFLRACKQTQVKYACFKEKNCSITKENRIRCQYCRYQKCLSLNMYSPGSLQDSSSETSVSSIPCRVCGAPSSGFHFGALTCEGCKGFFRRMAKERDLQHYQCSKNGLCEINTITRNLCKTCRYNKCVKVGMSTEASRIGRQPNTVKRAISLELQKKQDDKSKIPKCSYPAMRKIVGLSCERDIDMPPLYYLENRPSCFEFVSTIDNAAKELVKLNKISTKFFDCKTLNQNSQSEVWDLMMTGFEHDAHCVIHFAKKVPGFRAIGLQEQVKLVQGSIYAIVIITLSQRYDIDSGVYNYFNYTKALEENVMKVFPMLKILQEHLKYVGQIVKLFNFDQIEFAILSAILLLSGDESVISNTQVRESQRRLLSCLQEYEEKNYTNGLTRFGVLLLRLGELPVICQQHSKAIGELLYRHPHLNVPQLYKEMIIKE
ncbi:hypothetical protein ScPMuIL_014418 [Solemya velum]